MQSQQLMLQWERRKKYRENTSYLLHLLVVYYNLLECPEK